MANGRQIMNFKSLPLLPRLSEKTHNLSKQRRTYVFEVTRRANKPAVASAVQEQYGVKVEAVNLAVIKGKPKNSHRKGRRSIVGHRSDVRRAYVRLGQGHSLPIFDAVDAAEQQEKAAAKKSKKAAKESK